MQTALKYSLIDEGRRQMKSFGFEPPPQPTTYQPYSEAKL